METVELAKELIGFETISPVESPEIFEFLKLYLEDQGIDVEIHDFNGVKSLTAEIGDGGKSVCLNGHLDVVDPGSGWEVTQPFEPRRVDDRLYGRGAVDMKSAAAAQVKALIDLSEDDGFEGSATLMLVGDEEVGSENGTRALLETYRDTGYSFDYAIVGEPTDMDIQVGTRGVAWFNIYLRGDEIHSTRAQMAENAVEKLPEVLEKLSDMKMGYEKSSKLPEPVAKVTNIETDDTYNSIPGEIKLGMDVRYLPSQSVDEIQEEIRQAIQDVEIDIEVELEKDHGGAYELEDTYLKQVVSRVVEDLRDERPEHITEGGASDGRFFAAHGTPFVELGLNQEMVHQTDESCDVEELQKLRQAYYRTIKRLCSQEKMRKFLDASSTTRTKK